MKEFDLPNRDIFNAPYFFNWENLVEDAADMQSVVGLTGVVIYSSSACKQVTGYHCQELKGMNLFNLIHDDDLGKVRQCHQNIQNGCDLTTITYRIRCKSGEYKWVETTAKCLTSDFTKVLYCATRDISERKHAEQRLQFLLDATSMLMVTTKFDERLQNLANLAVPTLGDWCMVDVRPEQGAIRRVAAVNANARDTELAKLLLQNPPNENHPSIQVMEFRKPFLQTWFDQTIFEDIAHNAAHLELLKSIGVKSMMIVPLEAKDRILGTIMFISSHAGRRFYEDDLELAMDLSRRASMAIDNARLGLERETLMKRLNFLNHVSTTLSETLNYQETLSRLARLCVGAIADFTIIDIMAPGGHMERVAVAHKTEEGNVLLQKLQEKYPLRRGFPHPLINILMMGKPILQPRFDNNVLGLISYDEEHLDLLKKLNISSVIIVPILLGDRRIGAMSFVKTDPHEIYSNDDLNLAQEIASRAGFSIENSRLYKMSESAIQQRDEFLGIVSHDLKNPINFVRLTSEMIKRLAFTPEDFSKVKILATKVTHAVDKMKQLIEDLLEITKIEGGQFRLKMERGCIREVVSEIVEMMKPLADEKKVMLKIGKLSDIIFKFDRNRIFQVLSNLVGNAIKYNRIGGEIVIETHQMPRELKVSVTDTGEGIPAPDLPRVFDRFWQAKHHGNKGSGLGLAIVKGIVSAHGGRIEIESQVDVGSTFSFILPT